MVAEPRRGEQQLPPDVLVAVALDLSDQGQLSSPIVPGNCRDDGKRLLRERCELTAVYVKSELVEPAQDDVDV
jgi:hypothetical protein